VIIHRQLQWCLVLLVTLISIIGRLRFNGLILDFDYGIYQPDGSHYAYRTLTFLGVDSNVAAQRVVSWYQIHGVKNNIFPPEFLTPANEATWGLAAPRILYSLLSVPFVYLFGISGMLAVPICSFVILVCCVFRMSELKGTQGIGFLLVLVLCTSPTVLRWMIANITDSLLAALFGVVALLLMSKVMGTRWFIGISSLIVLTSITRFCLPIWIGIALVLWITQMRLQSAVVIVVSSISFFPTFLSMPSNAVLPASPEEGGFSKLVLLARSFLEVGFIEVAQLAAIDRILLVTVIAALIISLQQYQKISSKYFLAVMISVWAIGAINGTLGVNFRYQLPLLSFAAWVILANSAQIADWFSGRRVNIVGEKAQDELNSNKD
jgi:hypothetical protein